MQQQSSFRATTKTNKLWKYVTFAPRNVSTTQYQTGAGPSAAEGILQMSSGMGPRLPGAQQGGFGQTLVRILHQA